MEETLAILALLALPLAMAIIGLFVADGIRAKRGHLPIIDPAWRWLHARMEWILRKIRVIR